MMSRCSICNAWVIPGETYYYDDHNNVCHTYHNGIEFCPICNRLIGESSSNGKVTYHDGRFICGYCHKFENPVHDRIKLKEAFLHSKLLLQGKGFEFPPVNVDFASQIDFSGSGYSEGTIGITVSHLSTAQQCHKIKILFGLPKVMCSAVLGHELLHVWLNEENLKPEVNVMEGFCELGAGLIYKRTDSALSKRLFQNLEKNTYVTYSEGFKKMKYLLESSGGWQAVRNFVKDNSKLNV